MEKELLCSPEMRKINLCLCVCGGGARFCCCCHRHLALTEIHKDIILSVNLYVNFFFFWNHSRMEGNTVVKVLALVSDRPGQVLILLLPG